MKSDQGLHRDVNNMLAFARQKVWQTSKFCQTSRMFGRPYVGKCVLQAILCQTYGLAQMNKLPDLPKVCLVCLAGPALLKQQHCLNIIILDALP